MNKLIKTTPSLFLLALLFATDLFSQTYLNIIPQPNHVEIKDGASFELTSSTTLFASDDSKTTAKFFQKILKQEFDLNLKISKKSKSQQIVFAKNVSLNKEAYHLEVNSTKITITAAGKKGLTMQKN